MSAITWEALRTTPRSDAIRAPRGRVVRMRSQAESTELAELLARVARGDQEAFATFYDATSRVVFGIVLNVVRDRAQAEEVAQEVYVEAWKSAPRFDRRQGTPSAWLNTIAHRKAVDRVRSVERSTQRDQRHYEQTSATTAQPDVSEIVVANDEGRRVRDALEQLPDAQRTAVELAYFSGFSHREVAERLGIPLGTAKTRIRDAMKRLRVQLGEVSP
jgi:RNA polymerase sigma-70 factor (ECF subfamily)